MKRFEEDQDIVTIYFDKLTGQKTCISFKIIQEYFVDHLKPANVRLYDYYQQELTVFTVSLDDFYLISLSLSLSLSLSFKKKKNVMVNTLFSELHNRFDL